ncbi:IS256 family transposase, partial [Loigolactobacillus zhaoyuanensis]
QTDQLEQTVIQLYQKGITTHEISDLMEKMYGAYYTPQTVSNLTKVVNEQVEAFKSRTLSEKYAVIYLDATYLPLRRDTVAKEAVHIAIGIQPNGHKEVLSYKIAPTESGAIWTEVLADLKQRGVQQNLLFVADGLVGLASAVGKYYPEAVIQQCLVHVSRNISHRIRVKDRKEVLGDFKLIHQSSDKQAAEHSLANFINRWRKRYPKVTQGLLENQKLLTCFDFPAAIRASIYSTNLIESFNKKFKRQTKKREQFP